MILGKIFQLNRGVDHFHQYVPNSILEYSTVPLQLKVMTMRPALSSEVIYYMHGNQFHKLLRGSREPSLRIFPDCFLSRHSAQSTGAACSLLTTNIPPSH